MMNEQILDIIPQHLSDTKSDLIDYWSQQPLSDADYYSLMLGRYVPFLLALQQSPPTTPDALEWNYILIHQARFLITHGSPDVLSRAERIARFGDDPYIARMIVLCQQHHPDTNHWNELLWRIGSNANLFDSAIAQPGLNTSKTVIEFVQRRFDVTLGHPMNHSGSDRGCLPIR